MKRKDSMKIERLTPEQSTRFPEFVDKWTRIGLCTDRAKRKEAEDAMTLAYAAAGLPAPRFVWCDSPLSMALTRAIFLELLKKRKESGASVGASVRDSVWGNRSYVRGTFCSSPLMKSRARNSLTRR